MSLCIDDRLVFRFVVCSWWTLSQLPTTLHVWKTRGYQCSFRLLMMRGVSPETCWAPYKYGIIKFWYIVASCWIFLYECRRILRKRYHHRKLRNIHCHIHWEHCESTVRPPLWLSYDWCLAPVSRQHCQTPTLTDIWLMSCSCQQTALSDPHSDCHMTDVFFLSAGSTVRPPL